MRLLHLVAAAALLTLSHVGLGQASPTIITFNPLTPSTVGFAATGNATVFSGPPVALSLPVTGVDGPRLLHQGSGVDVTLPTAITGLPVPITVSAFDWVFRFDTNTVTAVIFNNPGPAVREEIANFAPGGDTLFLSPTLSALFEQAGITLPVGAVIGTFSVPVPGSLVLFATFGLALAGVAAMRRREPLRLAA